MSAAVHFAAQCRAGHPGCGASACRTKCREVVQVWNPFAGDLELTTTWDEVTCENCLRRHALFAPPGWTPPRPALRDPDQRYIVHLCAHCSHPGGQHRLEGGCRCGFCGGWKDAGEGYWSDAMTRQLEIDAGITREDGDGD